MTTTTLKFPSGEEMHLDMAPNQPRDRYGKWTNNPGSAVSGAFPLSSKPMYFTSSAKERAGTQMIKLKAAGITVVDQAEAIQALTRMDTEFGVPPNKLVDSLSLLPAEAREQSRFEAESNKDGSVSFRLLPKVDLTESDDLSDQLMVEYTVGVRGKPRAELDNLVIPRKYQGQGLGKKLLDKQVDVFLTPGSTIKEISIKTGLTVGGYAWGKFGFSPTTPADAREWLRYNTSNPTALKLVDRLKTKKDWFRLVDSSFGKELLMGSEWRGSLDLHDPLAMSRFRKYVKK